MVTESWHFEGTQCPHLQPKTHLPFKINVMYSLKTLGSYYPLTLHHIPEKWTLNCTTVGIICSSPVIWNQQVQHAVRHEKWSHHTCSNSLATSVSKIYIKITQVNYVSLSSFSWRFWHALLFCVGSPFSREGEWFVIQIIRMLINKGNETFCITSQVMDSKLDVFMYKFLIWQQY
jgi:ABC-type multidrug transport system ATPase subunit